jgi:hypothetical protein
MGYVFRARGTVMSKSDARADAISTLLKWLHRAKIDPRSVDEYEALLKLTELSAGALSDLAVADYCSKINEEKDDDEIERFWQEWPQAAKQYTEKQPIEY